MVNFKEIYHFSRFQRGSNIFQGGGGGSNCLSPIESHITCDFPGGGVRTPVPLSGSPHARHVNHQIPQFILVFIFPPGDY